MKNKLILILEGVIVVALAALFVFMVYVPGDEGATPSTQDTAPASNGADAEETQSAENSANATNSSSPSSSNSNEIRGTDSSEGASFAEYKAFTISDLETLIAAETDPSLKAHMTTELEKLNQINDEETFFTQSNELYEKLGVGIQIETVEVQ